MDNMLLIDGNSLINRAFYALPPLTNAKGEPTQAVYGFTTMLIKAIEDYKPKYIAVAFDLKAPTFRHLKYDGYKATRKGMPEELAVQLPILKELLKLMNISIVEKQGFEADDIIGTLAADDSVMTYIITGDRDSLQLIGKTTRVVLTKRGITDTVVLDEAKLMEDFALTPRQVIDYKSLAGDSSDNIPGVPGVGDKTALNLISRYSDLGGVYSHIDEIGGKLGERLRAGEQSALLSYELATIKTDVPLEEKTSDFIFDFPFSAPVRTFFADNGFKSLLKRDDIFAAGSEKAAVVKMTAVSEKRIESLEFLSELFSEAASFAVAFCDDIRISTDGAAEYVIPLNRSLVDTGFEYGAVIRALKPYLENSELKKYVFDGKRVKKTLKSEGTGLSGYDDVKLLQYLADMRVGGDSLTELLETLGYDKDKPAAALFLLGEELKCEIKRLGMEELYLKAELPLVDVLFDMEERGVQVDVKLLNKLGDKFISEADQLSKVIFELAGKRFNINSPRQLASVLFDDLKIPYPKKSAKHSTNAEILEMITEEHEIVPLVSKYRFIAKLNSTYIEGIRRLLTPDNIIHTDYKQMLTTTGRLSSAEPNLQNIPVREEEGKSLRGLFTARDGYTLVSADYSQIELRLLTHFSGDSRMLELYRNGEDIHTRTAAEVFGVPVSEVTSKMRREAKVVNFGIIYGMSDYGLSQSLKCSVSTARKYMETYFERFSSIKPYFDSIVQNAKKTGYTTTLLGRVRYIPELASPNYMTRQFGERAAMNMPLQGSAADIIKLAMVDVAARLKGLKSRLILQIHDELIVEADDKEVDTVKAVLKESMENCVSLSVPLTVDIECGKSWLDC
ncbi:MAG: DNA polymerase I [Christensenellales bacterium]